MNAFTVSEPALLVFFFLVLFFELEPTLFVNVFTRLGRCQERASMLRSVLYSRFFPLENASPVFDLLGVCKLPRVVLLRQQRLFWRIRFHQRNLCELHTQRSWCMYKQRKTNMCCNTINSPCKHVFCDSSAWY